MKPVALITAIAIFNLMAACDLRNNRPLFEMKDAPKSGITFINQIKESDSLNMLDFLNFYTGGGVATGDLNNDSLPDLFFSGNMVSSRLYLNKSTQDKIKFEDITEQAGVTTDQWITGVTMIDINQDGLLDIYACASGSKIAHERANKLFINQGIKNGVPQFKESAEEYGLNDTTYTTQASFFDYDKDGDLDVFLIVNVAENYYGNSVNLPSRKSTSFDSAKSDRLYKNTAAERAKGDSIIRHKFIDVSEEVGIYGIGYSLGLCISDVNNDGWPDIYIANDFLSNDVMYINNQDGTFSNKASEYMKNTSYAGMGTDIADFNNDGRMDIAVVDMIPEDNVRLKSMMNSPNYNRFMNDLASGYDPQFSRNTLQLNNGESPAGKISFSEIGRLAGIHRTDWSWSVLMGDYDNDGWKDIFITNGFLRDLQDLDFVRYVNRPNSFSSLNRDKKLFLEMAHQLPGVKVPNYLFRNEGNLSFENKSESWGMNQPSYSNGAVYADLDNDGDLDLVVNNLNQPPSIYQNTLSYKKENAPGFLRIRFAGPTGNRDGIGAKVEIKTGGGSQVYENYLTRGFQSSINAVVHVGLGGHELVDELKVTWPDGREQILKNVKANTHLVLEHGNATYLEPTPSLLANESLFTEVSKAHQIQYLDKEYDFVDFHHQRLIPFKLSQSGPGLAVGDIDGNGIEDFYIGGSLYAPGAFFIQDKNGKFESQTLEEDDKYEDMGALLFDAEGDGDLDLYIVSGSVEMAAGSAYYQDRLYVNDGEGNFTKMENALPEFKISGSCVTAADFDQDGDLDLFVGGRSVPEQYPLPASSKILLNESQGKDKPVFTDATDYLLPSLNHIGMVTASLWTDYNNDGWIDLMIIGEGMPITFFENKKGEFSQHPSFIIPDSRGFWNSIIPNDFDADGDMDYIIGNMGLNSVLKASTEEPVRIYAKDFDRDGALDRILCSYVMGKNVPFHSRDEFIDQMFIMRGIYDSYAKYAVATINDIFSEEVLSQAYVLQYENFATSYLQNNGTEGFQLISLPIEAQISSVYGMLAEDFDNDGIDDLLMVGNSRAPALSIGWYDASIGYMLKGKGDGTFVPMNMQKSGFYVDKDAKAVATILSSENQPIVLISSSADSLKAFQYSNPTASQSFLPLHPMDAGAKISYDNGRTVKREFQYGSGYLSQSTRHLQISNHMTSVTLYDFSGNAREVHLEKFYVKK